MEIKIKMILLIILFMTKNILFCQISQNSVSVPSPNAAGLGQYGKTGVSLFSGKVLTQVPISSFDIRGKRFSLDLYYNSEGVRPDIHPGWVGSNWSLSAGTITRIIHGFPDELNNDKFQQKGFYFQHSRLNDQNWASTDNILKRAASDYESIIRLYNTDANVRNDLSNKDLDLEPDEFVFNVLNLSGKFFLDENGVFKVKCDKPVKVVFEDNDFIYPFLKDNPTINTSSVMISKTFNKFKIIDTDGTQYIFGSNESIDYSDQVAGQYKDPILGTEPINRGRNFFATSWYLTKIISSAGITLANLTYTRGPFVGNLSSISLVENLHPQGGAYSTSTGSYCLGKIISPVYLKRVELPTNNTNVDFFISPSNELKYEKSYIIATPYSGDIERFVDILNITNGIDFLGGPIAPTTTQSSKLDRLVWAKLDSIQITNKNTGEVQKSFGFVYNNDPVKRLFLNELKMMDKNANFIGSYKFSYDETNLPIYNGSYNDAAGFYNGIARPNQVNLDYSPDFSQVKKSDFSYAKAGSMTKITYPTGGFTLFEYELNDYQTAVSDDKRSLLKVTKTQIGGLRIKKITDVDGLGNTSTKEYLYIKGYYNGASVDQLSSSGVINAIPKFDLGTLPYKNINGGTGVYSYKASNPIIPITSSDNVSLSYSEVVEKIKDNGYTIFYFTNHDNGHKDLPPVNSYDINRLFFLPATEMGLERGLPYDVKIFDKNNALLKETMTEYSQVGDSSTMYVRTMFTRMQRLLSSSSLILSGAANKIYYYSYLPSKVTEKEYTPQPINTTKTFEYNNNYKQVNKTSLMNSQGELLETAYKYPYDFQLTWTTNSRGDMIRIGDPIYAPMTSKNIISPIVEQTLTKTNTAGSSFRVSYMRANYDNFSNNYLPRSVEIQNRSAITETRKLYNIYDILGNNLEQQKAGDVKEVYLWGYNSQYPVAKIIGSDFSTISTKVDTSVLNNGTDAQRSQQFTNLRNTFASSPLVQIWTYTYTPLVGMTSETDPKGYTTYYEYDGFGRLIDAKDKDGNVIKKYNYHYQGQ